MMVIIAYIFQPKLSPGTRHENKKETNITKQAMQVPSVKKMKESLLLLRPQLSLHVNYIVNRLARRNYKSKKLSQLSKTYDL